MIQFFLSLYIATDDFSDLIFWNQYIGIGGLGIACLTILFFVIREERVKRAYKKLKQELDSRMQEIINQEKQITVQKGKLQKQIELSEEQSRLIHEQAIELDKHRHFLEKKIEIRTKELVAAKEKAEESDQLKTAFLENISHEVRTPMNAIIGFASLLAYPDVSQEDQEAYINRINKNSVMLLNFIDSVIDVSKVKAGQMNMLKTAFSARHMLKDLHREAMDEFSGIDLKIELKLPATRRDFILFSDPVRVRQVLHNLLSNAVKYTEKGKVTIGFLPLFNSNYDKEPSALQFFVEDTGIGISEEQSEYIFKWFHKLEADKNQIYRGAGMGLYLCREIVTLLGGKMWFNSKVGEGSIFYFTLPFLNTDDEQRIKGSHLKRQERQKESQEDFEWRNKTILIAEDEPSNVLYLQEIIKHTGAAVIVASNGLEAVRIVLDNPEISLVLMDIMMPEMDGYEATREVKKIRPRLPVIAQTAFTKAREKERSLEAGCEGYISKPYDPPALLKMISNFI